MDTSIAVFEVSLDLLSQGRDGSLNGILGSFHILVDLGPEVVAFFLWAWRCFSKSIHF